MLLTILPTVIYGQLPFPTRIKDHSFVTGIINKSESTTDEHEDLIKVKPQVALVMDLVTSDIEDSIIMFLLFPLTLLQPRIKTQFQVYPLYLFK